MREQRFGHICPVEGALRRCNVEGRVIVRDHMLMYHIDCAINQSAGRFQRVALLVCFHGPYNTCA